MDKQEKLVITDKIYQSRFNDAAGAYRATYEDRPVIVKTREDPIERELNVLRRLDDPRFPKIIEYGKADDGYRLVLEGMPGVPLAEYIRADAELKSRRLDDAESAGIIGQLALGLIALRDAGFYYRDMNMKHVLIDAKANDLNIALIDHEADVSIASDGTAVVETRTGTWETMAPEEFTVGGIMTEASSTLRLPKE